MSEQISNEKEEKESKSWVEWCGDWWRQDRLDAIGWAVFFVWSALVMLAEATKFSANFSWWDGWGVFFAGVGIIVIIGTVIRMLIPQYKRSVVAGFIFGFILLGIGLGGWDWILPLVFIAIAVTILVSVFKLRS